MADDLSEQLSKLKPEARSRVQDAIKATIERELVADVGVPGLEAGAHSRGILFSRATASMKDIEQVIINEAVQMDDVKFDAFVGRLQRLKKQG